MNHSMNQFCIKKCLGIWWPIPINRREDEEDEEDLKRNEK